MPKGSEKGEGDRQVSPFTPSCPGRVLPGLLRGGKGFYVSSVIMLLGPPGPIPRRAFCCRCVGWVASRSGQGEDEKTGKEPRGMVERAAQKDWLEEAAGTARLGLPRGGKEFYVSSVIMLLGPPGTIPRRACCGGCVSWAACGQVRPGRR